MENFYNLEDIKWILEQFEKKISKYSIKEYIIDDYTKVLLLEDSLALFVSIWESIDCCVGYINSTNPHYGETIYGLHIEEVSYNEIGFKYNHSEFLRFIKEKFNRQFFISEITYTKFRGYSRLYWCPDEPTIAEHVDLLLPELNLRERYNAWDGIKYYFIILELTDGDETYRSVRYTTQSPLKCINNTIKEYQTKNKNNVRASERKLLELIQSNNFVEIENNLKYFYVEKYFREKDDAWKYADYVLQQTNDGKFYNIERVPYLKNTKKWVREEMVCKLVTKMFKDYVVIPQHKPYFLKSSFGGQMSYDVYISKLNIAIEHQGKQHFEPIDFFGGEDSFMRQQIRDQEKKLLSEKYGVKLIYINYDEEITEELIRFKIGL